LEVASEYFRSGADKISIGSDAVYAAEAFLQTGVCILLFPLNVQLFPHYIVISLYQVKTGKSSLEQISRVYGNQVFCYFHNLVCFIAQLLNIK
jgi:glutamine amidotransferase/cyclase